jgi:hypothetical protein
VTAWRRFWYAPVPAVRLAAFRQALLFTLVFYMLARFMHAGEWLTAELGFHPSPAADRYHAPQVPLLTPALLAPFGVALFGSLALAIVGVLRRPATWAALLLVGYATLADPIAAFTLNRVYLFALLVLALAPAPGPDDTLPAWPLRVLQVHLAIHYLGAGLCKALHGDWLQHPDVLWCAVQGVYMTDAAAWMVRHVPPWAFTGQQHLALGFELLAPLLLAVRRLRPLAFVVGLGMHLIIAAAMYQLVYFSLQMACFYLLFVDPARLARWAARLRD